MGYRELFVAEIREILRLWLRGFGLRRTARMTSIDRKTIRRYISRAKKLGIQRDGGELQLTDEFIGALLSTVQPGRPSVRGKTWRDCEENREEIESWLQEGLTLTKVHRFLIRKGVEVPYRTLHRFCKEELLFRRQSPTMRVDDCDPGQELQVDFGHMGFIKDSSTGKKRRVWALILTSVFSRHCFVWLTHHQCFEDIVEGCDQAWTFFGGVFPVLIPDNMKAIVRKPDPIDPKFTERFLEYSQSRGFAIDSTRLKSPKDKPRVERLVPFVRNSFFKGELFRDLEDAQERARVWCLTTAGLRNHGTIHKQPLRVFESEEKSLLLDVPEGAYDIPKYADVTVHRDQHITIDRALYSMPTTYVGELVHVRADSQLVKIYHKRQLVKTHPRQPVGGRSSDPSDFPEEKAIYATRDVTTLQRKADTAGCSIGEFARRLLEHRETWRKMRAVFRLLGLVHRYGSERTDIACKRLLEVDVVDVKRVERMLRNALEQEPNPQPPQPSGEVAVLRFARPLSHFAIEQRHEPSGDPHDP